MSIPNDYLERVYAGVLGKLIGVYLGRPFEGWTYDKIMKELGSIEYYVHEKLGDPLVITDDDVAGTFTFIRALEDYDLSEDLSAEDIGKLWLNYIVEKRAILWWGGNGNSTEHTAWLNLKRGIPAPASGSIEINGLTVAEQIGAQIFIDGWALVAPGKPVLAAKLAKQAGSVSHDGESVYAGMLWAAMEAEAFLSADIDHLLDTGLAQIPADCKIAKLIADIRKWHIEMPNWRDCRQKIQDNYGYDKYSGNCHVMPNHALMIMAILYAPDDFSKGQMIVNTSGWDTDCNAGNVACLHGIMLGLDGLDKGVDWRGPIADRMLISSADGGNSINDAVRMAYYITNLGRQLDGQAALDAPKDGAQFHFSLPGSVQGFQLASGEGTLSSTDNALKISSNGGEVVATTPMFAPLDVTRMRTYDLMATPLVYPGQKVSARVIASSQNNAPISVALRMRHYGANDVLVDCTGTAQMLKPGEEVALGWTLPDTGAQPIAELGLVIDGQTGGTVRLDRMGWSGTPELTLTKPEEVGDFWHRAWVNGVDVFSKHFPESFHISHDRGEGLILHGTRDWTDYTVEVDLIVHLGSSAGVIARAQGLRRYYAARVTREGKFELVRQYDDSFEILASADMPVAFDEVIPISFTVNGSSLTAVTGDTILSATDTSDVAISCGAIGLMVTDGAASANTVCVSAPKGA
ncbi:MAG: ADP-ribosylglycohydrolase family protein [Alphaproteobacteria bacterium]|nr:ADP-ribosylglycohydrolase family protein [Alphaproteobacteria bacterium]